MTYGPQRIAGAVIALAALAGCGGSPAPPAARTITYHVAGDPADVTYGPAGSDLAGTVPMDETDAIGGAAYYAITVQLQGNGSVDCQISVDGTVLSSAVTNTAYGVAQCEIVRNAAGQWAGANGTG